MNTIQTEASLYSQVAAAAIAATEPITANRIAEMLGRSNERDKITTYLSQLQKTGRLLRFRVSIPGEHTRYAYSKNPDYDESTATVKRTYVKVVRPLSIGFEMKRTLSRDEARQLRDELTRWLEETR